MEEENASGHRGQEEGETKAEGDSANSVITLPLLGKSIHSSSPLMVPGTETRHGKEHS